jgi:hypothetical protein
MFVTLAGYDIMKGRALLKPTDAGDFAHLILACLFHDIGYVRGILEGDGSDGYVIDTKGGKTSLPRGSSDAALMPYHVDRSKLFVMDRIGASKLVDASRIVRAINSRGFPRRPSRRRRERGGLLCGCRFHRDSSAIRITCARRTRSTTVRRGRNGRQLGYASPADLTDRYPQFTGTTFRPISRPPSATSTSHRAGGSGHRSLQHVFAPSAGSICPTKR